MTSPSPADRTAEIRARLDAATPGPWKAQDYDDNPGDEGCAILGKTSNTMRSFVLAYSLPYPWHDQKATEADAALIANAPADLAYLLARVGELEGQIAAILPIASPDRETQEQRERNWRAGAWESFARRAAGAKAAANRWTREAERLEGWAAARRREVEAGQWPYEEPTTTVGGPSNGS
jgi:hypothetical protein